VTRSRSLCKGADFVTALYHSLPQQRKILIQRKEKIRDKVDFGILYQLEFSSKRTSFELFSA
jgi:hypothetical protein